MESEKSRTQRAESSKAEETARLQQEATSAAAVATKAAGKEMEGQRALAKSTQDALQAQLSQAAAGAAASEAKLSAAEQAIKTAEAATATQRTLTRDNQTKIDQLNSNIQARIAKLEAENKARMESVHAAAQKSQSQAVKNAVNRAEARHNHMSAKFDAQIKMKDSAIEQHQAHARQADTNFKKISLRETQTAHKHSAELMKNQAVIEAARQSALQQDMKLKELARQLRELNASGDMKDAQFAEHMRNVNSSQANAQLEIATLTKASEDLVMKAQQQEIGFAAQQHLLHQQSGQKIAEYKAAMDKVNSEKNAILEQHYAQNLKEKDAIGDLHDKMHSMLIHMHKNPHDTQVLDQMRHQSKEFVGDPTLGDLLRQAEGLHSAFKAKPAQQPFVTLAMQEEKMDIAEPPGAPVMAGKRPRSISMEAPTPEALRHKRGRLLTRVEDAYSRAAGPASEAMEAAQAKKGPTLTAPAEATQAVQNIVDEFNKNPSLNVRHVISAMDIAVEDRSNTNMIINLVENVQEGIQEAEAETSERQAVLDTLDEKQQVEKLEEDSLEARLALYDAKRREVMMNWQSDMPPETRTQVEAGIAKENARLEKTVSDIDSQIKERVPDKSASWRLTEEEAAAAMERNATYLKMAIRNQTSR